MKKVISVFSVFLAVLLCLCGVASAGGLINGNFETKLTDAVYDKLGLSAEQWLEAEPLRSALVATLHIDAMLADDPALLHYLDPAKKTFIKAFGDQINIYVFSEGDDEYLYTHHPEDNYYIGVDDADIGYELVYDTRYQSGIYFIGPLYRDFTQLEIQWHTADGSIYTVDTDRVCELIMETVGGNDSSN